jgi:predicted Ser/Thr protein kinase
MKYCPLCDRKYEDELVECEVDGATLRLLGAKQDPYSGKLIKGRYNVISKIGEGGMGSVYLAEQVSIGRKVALKVLQGNYASDDEFIGRFRREARLAASLNHRNIVTIYDFDQGNDGSLFLAMEYLQGDKLSEVIRKDGALDIGRAVRLGLQIADGLAAAHRAGVIHRDIKPDNVMVVGARGTEEVKLMDFGIARMMDTGTMGNLTRPGMIMGTPAYMAPEQAEGADVSEKTDIYALGIVLYEMLSGSVPFKASTPSAVLIKQLQESPAPLRKIRREVPAALERIVMQALEKKPQKRPHDMPEVVQELQKIAATSTVEDVPKTIMKTMIFTSADREAIKLPKRSTLYWGAGGALMVIVLGMAAYFISAVRSPSETVPMRVSIDAEKKQLGVGEKIFLRATVAKGGDEKAASDVVWRSSNESVIAMSSKGEAEALKEGAASVVASYQGVDSGPVTLTVKGLGPLLAKIDGLRKKARDSLDHGDYQSAFKVLHEAMRIDSNNNEVKKDIEQTRKACLAEQRVGLTKIACE